MPPPLRLIRQVRSRDWSALLALALAALLAASVGSGKRLPRRHEWSDADLRAFRDAVGLSGVPLEAALAVYAAESGLDPAASSGVAWGLPQAQGPLLRAAGFTAHPSAFARLSVAEQAPIIGRILRLQSRSIGYVPSSAVELYRANFSPAAARARAHVIYRRSEPSERAAYEANRALDVNRTGQITLDDLARVVARAQRSEAYQRVLRQMHALPPDQDSLDA